MKIAIINYSSNGLFYYACSLVNSLARLNNIQEILFITSNKNDLSLIDDNQKVTVLAQNTPHKLIPFLFWCINLNEQLIFRSSLKKFQPNIIHILDVYPNYLFHHFLLKKHNVVFTQHDPTTHTGDPHSTVIKLIHFYLQSISKKIVVHGKTLKDDLLRHFKIPSRKIAIIPHGDLSILLRHPPQGSKIPRSILFFGRINHYKGLDILLDSLLALQKKRITFHLTIAGHGNLKKYQPQIDKITNHRVINKKIPNQDISSILHQHEIIVLPYREATQSGIVSLALPAEIPIIASRVGAIPEILINEYNSLLVSPNNQHELELAIKRLLDNPKLRHQLITGGIETVKNKINWNIIANQHHNTYLRIQNPYE